MLFFQRALLALAACMSFIGYANAQGTGYDLKQGAITDTAQSLTFNYTLEAGATLTILIQDSHTLGTSHLQTFAVSGLGDSCTMAGCINKVFSAGATGAASMTVNFQAQAGETGRFYIECRGPGGVSATSGCAFGGATGGGGGGGGGGTSGSSAGAQSASSVTAATGAASSGAVSRAIRSALSTRQGGSTVAATRNRLFFAAQSDDTGASFWGQITGTSFSGTLDGDGAELTFGADFEISPGTVLGLALSYGTYDITSAGTPFDNKALSFGPYISTQLSDRIELDAYLLYARPEYTSAGLSYRSKRVMLGIEARMSYTIGQLAGTGYLALSGFDESLPAAAPGGARNVSQTRASVGTRVELANPGVVQPYVMLGLDAVQFDNGFTTDNSVSPTLGLGFTAQTGTGTLYFSVDGSEVFDGARATSVSLGYDMKF